MLNLLFLLRFGVLGFACSCRAGLKPLILRTLELQFERVLEPKRVCTCSMFSLGENYVVGLTGLGFLNSLLKIFLAPPLPAMWFCLWLQAGLQSTGYGHLGIRVCAFTGLRTCACMFGKLTAPHNCCWWLWAVFPASGFTWGARRRSSGDLGDHFESIGHTFGATELLSESEGSHFACFSYFGPACFRFEVSQCHVWCSGHVEGMLQGFRLTSENEMKAIGFNGLGTIEADFRSLEELRAELLAGWTAAGWLAHRLAGGSWCSLAGWHAMETPGADALRSGEG